ncbi:helix-turn-helix domain-containing protein [Streptomyces lydicamycinicus]|uniref:helix-turn-helix domain-containing protein n=1 Tax=Streptomyces lydicamycinicus TaxID=1546107 RepID=UPI003C2F742D
MFGEVLRHFREAAGLTQEELSNKIPCDRSQVARVEAGTRVPQDTFAKQCDELLGTGECCCGCGGGSTGIRRCSIRTGSSGGRRWTPRRWRCGSIKSR